MSAIGPAVERGDPDVVELDGPPKAFFEIPLEYWSTPNGELEPEGHPEAERLVQRIVYLSFRVGDALRVKTIIDRVTARLKSMGDGIIWWRQRPTPSEGYLSLRLATSPALPPSWWETLSRDVENKSPDFASALRRNPW